MATNAAMRQHMILGQLYTNDIRDKRILDVMSRTPREEFVPDALKGAAYADDDLHVGNNRYLMEPLAMARLIDMAQPTEQSRVLIIGGLYGYAAAILAPLCKQVVMTENKAEYITHARKALASLAIANVTVHEVPALTAGYATSAPYDVIIIPGAVEFIPETLPPQLGHDGRLVTVRRISGIPGSASGLGKGLILIRDGTQLYTREHFDIFAALLPEFNKIPTFQL